MRDDTLDQRTLSHALLDWYDHHARSMPWRVPPQDRKSGVIPDPYKVWLSEVMLQQTTVAAVKDYFHRFTIRWPTVQALARAQDDDVMAEWAGLGYYARARNLLKCARAITDDYDGQFPKNHDLLLQLPGVGPYTAAAVSAIAFDLPETVLDGNVERVMARMYDIHTPLPGSKNALKEKATHLTPDKRPGDYAQAVMDLGATICSPKSPACGLCPWRASCLGWRRGTAEELPKKTPKTPKPTRHGHIYIARTTTGSWLLERRPETGLLGGMLGWPGSEWATAPEENPPFPADWHPIDAEIRHTFTHFHLRLKAYVACVPDTYELADHQRLIARHDFTPDALPTVMRKAFDLCRTHSTLGSR